MQSERVRVGLLSAWPWDPARGGGTARFLREFRAALEDAGLPTLPIDAGLDLSDYRRFVIDRIAWNRNLAGDPRIRDLELLLALDCDGGYLPPPPAGIPRIVCPQAVFKAIAATEPEPFRTDLLRQADLEERNLRGAAEIIAPSSFTADSLARAYGIDRGAVRVIPHGFDLRAWSEDLAGANERESTRRAILTVAGLYPRKGIDTLLRAIGIIRGRADPPIARIVGDGIDRERLENLARELGVEDLVRFEGEIADRKLLASLYKSADMFCLPSRHETFGYVFLEAMAAGLPIVAARAGAAEEVIGEAGLLVPVDDPQATAAAIARLLDEPVLAQRIANEGIDRSARFRWPDAARAYIATIWEVATRHPGPRPSISGG